MQESIDTFFKIDECTAVCNLNNWSCDDLADWVSFSDCVPWILLKLLEAKGYSLLVQVPTKDLSFNNIADVDDLLRVGDSLCPGKFRDVCKTFDTRLDFNEYTEVGNLCDRSLYNIANLILLVEC